MMAGETRFSTILDGHKNLQNATKTHSPPDGCILKNDREHHLWETITKSKAYERWNQASLLIAFKCVKLEVLVRHGYDHLETLLDAGANPYAKDSIANEAIVEIGKLEKQLLTHMRSLGLTYTAIQSKSSATAANREREAAEALGIIGDAKLPSMLARN